LSKSKGALSIHKAMSCLFVAVWCRIASANAPVPVRFPAGSGFAQKIA
jgi:hypothetical protein